MDGPSTNLAQENNAKRKHRLAAIISQQNQQIQIIQEELDQLETLGESSLVCQQLILSVESSTDALLPVVINMDSPDNQHSKSKSTIQTNGGTKSSSSGILRSSTNFIGKHRLAAIISQQNQQIQIIQEELDQLETLGESSLVCQ
nr:guanine nucleotide-binding protein subunit gamma 2-like [Tanacetum cinerariifolium]